MRPKGSQKGVGRREPLDNTQILYFQDTDDKEICKSSLPQRCRLLPGRMSFSAHVAKGAKFSDWPGVCNDQTVSGLQAESLAVLLRSGSNPCREGKIPALGAGVLDLLVRTAQQQGTTWRMIIGYREGRMTASWKDL